MAPLKKLSLDALAMEEAIQVVLREAKLTPEERGVLEQAVRIARNLQKSPGGGT